MNLFKALYAGYSLKNSASWKSKQVLVNIFVTITGAAIAILLGNDAMSIEDINAIGTGIGVIAFSVYNAYCVVATTDKIGLPTPIEVVPTEVPLPESRPVNPTGSTQNPGDGLV